MAKEKKNKKPRKRVSAIDIILLIVCFCVLCLSCVLFYQNVYLERFFVSGQSMWPTLNQYALDENGKLVGQEGRDKSGQINTKVEVGVMDTHKAAKKRIKRFDIVATYYPEDFKFPDKKSEKIKRIIGLPGETLIFTYDGDLYINDSFVEQPIDSELIKSGAGTYEATKVTLANDEYYVMGDNRKGHLSEDSRSVGAIKKDWIVGKVIAICGMGIVSSNGGVKDVKHKDIDYYKWPRFKL